MLIEISLVCVFWFIFISYINKTRFSCFYFFVFPFVLTGFLLFKNFLSLYPNIDTVDFIIFFHFLPFLLLVYMISSDIVSGRIWIQNNNKSLVSDSEVDLINVSSDRFEDTGNCNDTNLDISNFSLKEANYFQGFNKDKGEIYAVYRLSLFVYMHSDWIPVEYSSEAMNDFYNVLQANHKNSSGNLMKMGIVCLTQLKAVDLKKMKIPPLSDKYLGIIFP